MMTLQRMALRHESTCTYGDRAISNIQCSCESMRARSAAFADSSKQGSSAAVQTHAGCLELFLGAWAVLFTAPESLKLSLVRAFYIDINL